MTSDDLADPPPGVIAGFVAGLVGTSVGGIVALIVLATIGIWSSLLAFFYAGIPAAVAGLWIAHVGYKESRNSGMPSVSEPDGARGEQEVPLPEREAPQAVAV